MAGSCVAVYDHRAWTSDFDQVVDRTGARALGLVFGDSCVPDLEFDAMSSLISPRMPREHQE